MIMGAFLGKKYPLKKYLNVCIIVVGIALFMMGGNAVKADDADKGRHDDVVGMCHALPLPIV